MLETYQRKRNFQRTAEPSGNPATSGRDRRGRTFVIQKHDASTLHYDLRLEHDGVLKSWAVPKGPSLDPADKRLAVATEDHPLDYADFEGIIPAGQYGGGTVIVWDVGTWELVANDRKAPSKRDVSTALERGKLKFRLHGKKFGGAWELVRTRSRSQRNGKDNWLLMKRRDDHATEGDGDRILKEQPASVLTGRDLVETGAAHAIEAMIADVGETLKGRRRLDNATGFLPPQLATLYDEPPIRDGWWHELKYDGYRLQAHLRGGRVVLYSRRGHDWTERFPRLVAALAPLTAADAILDGEAVVFDQEGRSHFAGLQAALREERSEKVRFAIFDLLALDGRDLRPATLAERKKLLADLLAAAPGHPALVRSEHLRSHGREFYREACQQKAEGIVSKDRNASYRGGRTSAWRKVKCIDRQEFVICGYTPPAGSRHGFGAIALAVRGEDGAWHYRGKVGTGFDDRTLTSLAAALKARERKTPPVADPPTDAAGRQLRWVKPELIAEIAFRGFTSNGLIRQGAFQGLREDKQPAEVQDPQPMSANTRQRSARKPVDPAMASPDEVAGVRISNPGRVIFPDAGVTKGMLARYYEVAANTIAPWLDARPLSFLRCPRGRATKCFFQKHFRDHVPPGLDILKIAEKEGKQPYATIADPVRGLVGLAQFGVIELHAWNARRDDLARPDQFILDLDPGDNVTFEALKGAAFLLRDLLADRDLTAFVKTTGGKGLHLHVPLVRRWDWDTVKAFSRHIGQTASEQMPKQFTLSASKSRRPGRIFIDYLRNSRGATSVVPWTVRARSGAPVAMPLSWRALGDLERPDGLLLHDVLADPRQLDNRAWSSWRPHHLKKAHLPDDT